MTQENVTVYSETKWSARGWLARLHAYWSLTKSLQTGLLVLTGLAGYISARPRMSVEAVAWLVGSLFLAIAGSTILNMVSDQDIDAKMKRTARRPLPSGAVTRREALVLGTATAALGVSWAFALDPLFGAVVFAGLFFDVVVYTLWLKRRTPWSIVWGGISGGMPILAGRALGIGTLDSIGLLLALAILFWIPTHIMSYSLRNSQDYCLAGVPIFPTAYGAGVTRLIMALSTAAAVIVMLIAGFQLGMDWNLLQMALALGVGLIGLAVATVLRPSPTIEFTLYKLASLYMLAAMLLIVLGVQIAF